MNAVIKTLAVASLISAAALAHAYQPQNGEPVPTVSAEIALQGFAQAVREQANWTTTGEPIPNVAAEQALQGFMQVADGAEEPQPNVAAEKALQELIPAARGQKAEQAHWTEQGEPIPDVAAEKALQGFMDAAEDADIAKFNAQLKTVRDNKEGECTFREVTPCK